MRKLLVIVSLLLLVILSVSFTAVIIPAGNLRKIYSQPASAWPKPFVDDGVEWKELGVLPASPAEAKRDSLREIIELGKILFFDPRLSSSGKISCASCHQPELHWTDGKERSVGHEGTITKRNAPTIQNSWFYHRLFWDGRSRDLQDQAFAPIVSESEMNSDMPDVMRKLRSISGYRELFKKAFGSEEIGPDRMTEAIAIFEKTIVSGKSRFDQFLEGDTKALSNSEIRGLHLFRTRARCINCHYGPLFSDNSFHNSGFSNNDAGYYKVTHKDEDSAKFKTPSLRDATKTGPWMHDGGMKDIPQIISSYSRAQFPAGTDPLIKPSGLSAREQKDLLNFLQAISAEPLPFKKPVLPQ